MNDNWIEEKAREVIEKIAIEAEMKCIECGSVQCGASYDPAPIAAALREAENRGLEKAAQICHEKEELYTLYARGRIELKQSVESRRNAEIAFGAKVCKDEIEALKTGEGR